MSCLNNNPVLFVPQYIIICISISMVLALIMIRIKNGNCNLTQYFSNYVCASYSKRTSVDLLFSIIGMVLKGICTILLMILSAAVIWEFAGNEFLIFVNSLSKLIPDEMLEWVTLMITLSAILVTFKKDYYLVFSLAEVLERYKFKSKILTIVNIMILSRIIIIVKSLQIDETYKYILNFIYLLLYITALILGCYLIYRVMYLLFSKEQSELDLLDKLYYKVSNRTLYFDNNFNSNITGMFLNYEYLFDQYLRNYEKVKKYEICKVKYESVHNTYNDLAYKKIKKLIFFSGSIFLAITNILCLIKIIILYKTKNKYDYNNDVISIIASLGTWLFCIIYLVFLGKSKYTKIFKQLTNRMFLSDYVYTYEDKLENQYFTSTSGLLIGKKNEKYFISILNLAVYFKMIINSSTVEDVEKFEQHIENIYHEAKCEVHCKDEIFYIVSIYFGLLRYESYPSNRESIVENMKSKGWAKIINKRRIQGLMKAIIGNTQNLFTEDGIKVFSEFTNRIKTDEI